MKGTASRACYLKESCWDPVLCVLCYRHQLESASSAFVGVQQARPCPLEPAVANLFSAGATRTFRGQLTRKAP